MRTNVGRVRDFMLLALLTMFATFVLVSSDVAGHPASIPAQITTLVTVNATVTTTASTAVSVTSTTSSTTLLTSTSVTTISSTLMTYGGGQGTPGIPGFTWEAITLGIVLGILVLGIARRNHTAT